MKFIQSQVLKTRDEEKEVSLREAAERIYSSGANGQTPDFEAQDVPAGEPVGMEALSTCVLRTQLC